MTRKSISHVDAITVQLYFNFLIQTIKANLKNIQILVLRNLLLSKKAYFLLIPQKVTFLLTFKYKLNGISC